MSNLSWFRLRFLLLLAFIQYIICITSSITSKKAVVFGATGGLGQWCSNYLFFGGYDVHAVTRDKFAIIEQLNNGAKTNFELLRGCKIVQANARVLDASLIEAVKNAECVIISVGTTAFPSKKWDGGNTPLVSCVDTVDNILSAVEMSKTKPKTIVLLSSIGVERSNTFPFKILNLYGILDAKLQSEKLFSSRIKSIGAKAVIVRPGRLVGAPFTNTDLAKLFQIDQGSNKGLVVDVRETLAGDVERKDVAEAIVRLVADSNSLKNNVLFSIINKPGPPPTEYIWGKLLSLFTASEEDMLSRRES